MGVSVGVSVGTAVGEGVGVRVDTGVGVGIMPVEETMILLILLALPAAFVTVSFTV